MGKPQCCLSRYIFNELDGPSLLSASNIMFPDVVEQPVSTLVTSDIGLYGGGLAVPFSIQNGEYSLDGGPFVSSDGMISPGQSLMLRTTSPANLVETTTAIYSIGSVENTWNVSTKSIRPITTSGYARFVNQTGGLSGLAAYDYAGKKIYSCMFIGAYDYNAFTIVKYDPIMPLGNFPDPEASWTVITSGRMVITNYKFYIKNSRMYVQFGNGGQAAILVFDMNCNYIFKFFVSYSAGDSYGILDDNRIVINHGGGISLLDQNGNTVWKKNYSFIGYAMGFSGLCVVGNRICAVGYIQQITEHQFYCVKVEDGSVDYVLRLHGRRWYKDSGGYNDCNPGGRYMVPDPERNRVLIKFWPAGYGPIVMECVDVPTGNIQFSFGFTGIFGATHIHPDSGDIFVTATNSYTNVYTVPMAYYNPSGTPLRSAKLGMVGGLFGSSGAYPVAIVKENNSIVWSVNSIAWTSSLNPPVATSSTSSGNNARGNFILVQTPDSLSPISIGSTLALSDGASQGGTITGSAHGRLTASSITVKDATGSVSTFSADPVSIYAGFHPQLKQGYI